MRLHIYVDQLTVRRVAKVNAVSGVGVVESRRRGGVCCGLSIVLFVARRAVTRFYVCKRGI